MMMPTQEPEEPGYVAAFRHVLRKPEKALFLDIETAGPQSAQYTTVIGWSLGGVYKCWVKREPLQPFFRDLGRAHSLVTFNGRAFDIPFLEKEFPEMKFPEVHLDLMQFLWGLGLKGGQKRLEIAIGLERPADLTALRGYDAIKLWREFGRTKNKVHLETLIRYNREDVMNMIPLLAHGADLHSDSGEKIRVLLSRGDEDVIWV